MSPKPELPAHVIVVRLPDLSTREVDLRLVSEIEMLHGLPGIVMRGAESTSTDTVIGAILHFYGGPFPLRIHAGDAAMAKRAHRVQQERRAAVGETSFSGENLDEREHPLVESGGGLNVYSWTPERDGRGKPQQVHLGIDIVVAGLPITVIHRFKTRGALDALIDAMVKHREDVWPTT